MTNTNKQTVILRFCHECGALLHPSLATQENPECEDCGVEVRTCLQRAEGVFSIADARLLEIASFGMPVSMYTIKEKSDA